MIDLNYRQRFLLRELCICLFLFPSSNFFINYFRLNSLHKNTEGHMLKFENVSKVFNDEFKAVDSVSFEVQKVEFLVLFVPSGSGKSTTTKMINRMERHTSGTITINNKDDLSYTPL